MRPFPTSILLLLTASIAAQTTATAVPVGAGCSDKFDSFYEVLAASNFDLSGQTLSAFHTGTCYLATMGPGAIIHPGPAATAIPLADDGWTSFGTLGLEICSNGQVAFAPGNSSAGTPSVGGLLNNVATAIYSWSDLDPTAPGGGLVFYEEQGSVGVVTYWEVFTKGRTVPNTVQITVETITGDFWISWGAIDTGNPTDWLIGYSRSGPSTDPGPTDVSELATSPMLFGQDGAPLDLAAVGRPIQSTAPSVFQVTTSNLPAPGLHVLAINLGAPTLPVPLPPAFPTTCRSYMQPGWIVADPGCLVVSGPTMTCTGLALPAAPVWHLGVDFHLQAFYLAGTSALSSNGLACTVGDV